MNLSVPCASRVYVAVTGIIFVLTVVNILCAVIPSKHWSANAGLWTECLFDLRPCPTVEDPATLAIYQWLLVAGLVTVLCGIFSEYMWLCCKSGVIAFLVMSRSSILCGALTGFMTTVLSFDCLPRPKGVSRTFGVLGLLAAMNFLFIIFLELALTIVCEGCSARIRRRLRSRNFTATQVMFYTRNKVRRVPLYIGDKARLARATIVSSCHVSQVMDVETEMKENRRYLGSSSRMTREKRRATSKQDTEHIEMSEAETHADSLTHHSKHITETSSGSLNIIPEETEEQVRDEEMTPRCQRRAETASQPADPSIQVSIEIHAESDPHQRSPLREADAETEKTEDSSQGLETPLSCSKTSDRAEQSESPTTEEVKSVRQGSPPDQTVSSLSAHNVPTADPPERSSSHGWSPTSGCSGGMSTDNIGSQTEQQFTEHEPFNPPFEGQRKEDNYPARADNPATTPLLSVPEDKQGQESPLSGEERLLLDTSSAQSDTSGRSSSQGSPGYGPSVATV